MRPRIIVLLAVCSNLTAAGIMRHNGARAQHRNAARFLNHTDIPSIPADLQTSTIVPISSSSVTPSTAASPETSLAAPTSSTAPAATALTPEVASSSTSATDAFTTSALSQVLTTSATLPTALSAAAGSKHSEAGSDAIPTSTEAAVVQPAETLSRLFNLAGNPSNDLQSSTNAQSLSSTSSPTFSASLSAVSDVSSTANNRKVAATSSSSSIVNQVPTLEVPLTTTAITGASQVMFYSTQPVPISSSDAASQASPPVIVPVPISSGLVQVLGADGDTANEFAPVTLNPSSPVPTGTAKYPTADNGNTAMAAGFNSVYKTLNVDSPCNPNNPSQAYACVDGEIAECQSDETYVLKSCPRGQSCYALPKASGLTGIVVQCAVPSDAYSLLAGLSSSTAFPVAVTSQPVQISQVKGGVSQATQSVSEQTSVQSMVSSPPAQATVQSQLMASALTVLAVASTPSPAQGSNRFDNFAISTSTSPTSAQSVVQSQALQSPVLAMTASTQQVHDSNLSNNSPKSDTSPSVPSTTADVVSIPKALFAVVTPPGNDQALSSEKSKQASLPSSQALQPYLGISTPVIQSSAISPAPTGVSVNQKLAVGNGQATVTVTVTVTTTERPAPVTIVSS